MLHVHPVNVAVPVGGMHGAALPPLSSRSLGVAAAEEAECNAELLRSNFSRFSVNFAIHHGVVTTPIVLATSVLAGSSGYMGNALLNIFTMLGSFLLAAPILVAFGLRGGVLFGMTAYCIYAALFTVAAFFGRDKQPDFLGDYARMLQLVIFGVGSAICGVAAGILWTAQGAYFNRTVDLIRSREGGARYDITSNSASRFGVVYLSGELSAKLLWSLLAYMRVADWVMAVVFTSVGIFALSMQLRASTLSSVVAPRSDVLQKIKVAASLWVDPALWLASGINLTFGFSSAFIYGYINEEYTKPALGEYAVTLMASLTVLLACVLSDVFGKLSTKVGNGPVVILGSLSFCCIPLCFLTLNSCSRWVFDYVVRAAGVRPCCVRVYEHGSFSTAGARKLLSVGQLN